MTGLGRMARSARVRLHEAGVRGLAHTLQQFLFCRDEMSVFGADLTQGYTMPKFDARIEMRPGTAADLAWFRALPEGGRSEFYRDEIDGAEPWVAFWDGKLAHIGWIYTWERPSRFVRLKPGQAELRFGYTIEEYRGKGLYPALNAAMTAELARRGFTYVCGVVGDWGRAYRLGLELSLKRIGWKPQYTFVHQRVLGVQVRPWLSL